MTSKHQAIVNTQPGSAPEPIGDLGDDPKRWCGFGLLDGNEDRTDERIAAGDDDEDDEDDEDEDGEDGEDGEDEFDDEGEDDADEDEEEEAEGS
jgi:hypothetical protein